MTVDEARVTNFGYAAALTPVPCSDGRSRTGRSRGWPTSTAGRSSRSISRGRLAAAGTGGKRAVVSVPAGEVALRIQDVAVVKDGEGGESLDIQALQPWTACPSSSGRISAEAGRAFEPYAGPDDRFEPGVPV